METGQRWVRPLLDHSEGNARRELLSIMEERDTELLGESLLSFAGRQESSGQEALASEIYATLSRTDGGELSSSVSDRARRRLAALSGEGSVGDRVEVLTRHFFREATDPVTLLAMTVGSAAYATARVSLLARMVSAPSGAFTRGLMARGLAASGAFAVEVPTFWAVNKGLREAIQPGSQSWDLATNAQELASLSLTLGGLKLAGFGAASLHRWSGIRNPLSASLFRQAGMFSGILAGHGLERMAGLRPGGDAATTLLDSFVLLLQFNVGGRLSHELMGPRWAGVSSELEARLQTAAERPRSRLGPPWTERIEPPLAMAMSGSDDGAPPRPGRPAIESSRPQLSFTQGGAAESPARVWRNLLEDVVARGQRGEIEILKNILREALESHGDKSYIRNQLDRWRTKDPEEWRSGISRIKEMLEGNPGILESVESAARLRDFAADWNSRPHFTSGSQISLVWGKGLGGSQTVVRFANEMREHLAVNPNLRGMRLFLQQRQNRGHLAMTLERQEAERTTVYFNLAQKGAAKAGVKVQFNPAGHLQGPIEVRLPFNSGTTVGEIEALPMPAEAPSPKAGRPRARTAAAVRTVAPPGAAKAGSEYGPRVGENQTEWAMRLLAESRSPDREVALNIAQEMERRLADPQTAEMARGTIERWVSLTNLSDPSALSGIVARQYRVEGMRAPITIVSLPTTFLPETWSQTFAEGLASYKRHHQPRLANRAIEMGSGTGWASIVLSKLGLAREIIAVDTNVQAAVVGRLNAAFNGADNIRFETGDLMSGLAPAIRADLIIACLPQVKKNGSIQGLREVADYYAGGSGNYFDRFGLGLIERALGQATVRLERDGLVLFNLGGRPGRAVLEDLYATQGFRPRVLSSRMIAQDAGTDISSLAAQESASGQRFEFFHPENPKEPISATEAMSLRNPHHMLYFMEGRPYSDLLRRGLERRLEEGGRIGYTRDAGSENPALRESLARELSRDFGFQITPEVIHLSPSSDTALEGLLRVLPTENGPVIFAGLGNDLMPGPLAPYAPLTVAPRFGDIEAAVTASSPSAVVLQVPREAWADRGGLSSLLRSNGERRIHTILLEDQPLRMPNAPHPLMEVMSNSLPAAELTHIIHSLDRRYAVPGMPLAALVSGNGSLQLHMERYADLTHSRASSLIQDAYARFLDRPSGEEAASNPLPGVLDTISTDFSPSTAVARALNSKAFEASPRAEHPDPIAMNFGESEWVAPLRLGPSLWDATEYPYPALESQARSAVVEYLLQSRGLRVTPDQILLGAGVQPLMISALRGMRDISGGNLLVAVPKPSYGLFFPSVELSGARLIEYSTRPEARFLTENGFLGAELQNGARSRLSAVLINEPSNPAGQYHSPEALRSIARQVETARGYLLFDDVFGMLDFGRIRQRRTPSMQVLHQALGHRLVAFGGVSKEFAAGGLRFGFAVVGDPNLAQAMRANAPAAPDPLALNIAPVLLRNWEPLLGEHRTYLSSRAYQLEQVFRERQLPILEAQGGYSLLANLEFLHGRRVRLRNGGEAVIGANNLHELLASEAGLRVYSEDWARQRGHYRFVFSIDRLDEAVERLKKFFRSAR